MLTHPASPTRPSSGWWTQPAAKRYRRRSWYDKLSRPGPTTLTAPEIMSFVAEQVAPYKKVRQVEFVDAIPKSASGKILRRELRGH